MKYLFLLVVSFFVLTAEERGWISIELAEMYKENSDLQYMFAKELLSKVSFDEKSLLLDFGCGDGKITKELAERIPLGEVTGVDLSAFMIELANKEFPKELYPNLTFIKSNSDTFSEISGMYDVITSFCVMHFVSNPVEILKHFHSHLKEGGRLLLTIPIRPNQNNMKAANSCFAKYGLSSPWHLPGYSNDLSIRTLESAKEKLEKTGFEIVYLEKIEKPYIFESRESLINWFIGTTSANWGIPFNLAHDFFNDYLDEVLKITPELQSPDGTFLYTLPRIHIIAKI
jgi:trans-aconitate methyltransferase